MKLHHFAIATLVTSLVSGSLVAQQQRLPAQTQNVTPPAQQSEANQAQENQARERLAQERQAQERQAQPNQGRAAQGNSGQRSAAVGSQSQDQIFARLLAITNEEQVLIARFAQDKATNDDVKAFAATLEKDHQSCVDELKGLASEDGTNRNSDRAANRRDGSEGETIRDPVRAATRRDGAQGETNRDPARAATRRDGPQGETNRDPARAALRRDGAEGEINRDSARAASRRDRTDSSNVDFLQLHQEMSEQCLIDSKEMLSEKEGVEFDKCFVGMQVAKHAAMGTCLTVLQRHATGELQGLIKESLEKNAEHLQAAVSLMEKLDNEDSATTSTTAE